MNLQYWRQLQKISRRVAREVLELSEYNLEIHHIKGKANGRADALSRRLDYDQGEHDNEGVTVLPKELFICTATISATNSQNSTHVINPDEAELNQPLYTQNEDTLQSWVDPHQLKQIH